MKIQFNISYSPVMAAHLAAYDHGKLHDALSVQNSDDITFTLNGQQLTAVINAAVKQLIQHGATAYGWGNHALAEYFSSNDPQISNWNNAYNWGNHAVVGYESQANKNVAGGYAGLDMSTGKLLDSLVPDFLLGQVKYKGLYDISTDSIISSDPEYDGKVLPQSSESNIGIYFIIKTGGSIDNVDYNVGDWIISNGDAGWSKVDNTDAVATVNGQTGNVVLTTSHISEGNNLYYTDERVRAYSDLRYAALNHNHVGVYEPSFGFSTYFNQAVKTTSTPTFANLEATGYISGGTRVQSPIFHGLANASTTILSITANYPIVFGNAAGGTTLSTEWARFTGSGDFNHTLGKYQYFATSPTADAVFDRRVYSDAGGNHYFQYCGVANATKGSGGWTTSMVTSTTYTRIYGFLIVSGSNIRANVLRTATSNSSLIVTAGDANQLVLLNPTNEGNVAIGKVTASEKLDVNGSIIASGYKSSDGSEGRTTTFYDRDGNSITVKNGLIV